MPSTPPFVLPDDQSQIEELNRTAKPEHFIHLENMPEPFLGRPDASVVLLNLNPGHKLEDQRWHTDSSFLSSSRRNLLHEALEHPFYLLDPAFQSPGNRWWSRRLRQVIKATSLATVSRSVLCVEYFPYHSRRFAHRALRVPSQAYSHDLVRLAITRGAVIVAMRSLDLWIEAVPELAAYPAVHRVRSVQNPAVTPRNLPTGFAALLELLRRGTEPGRVTAGLSTNAHAPPAKAAATSTHPKSDERLQTMRPTHSKTDRAGRDITKFQVRLGMQVHHSLAKNRTIHVVVGYLLNRGIAADTIKQAMVFTGASRKWISIPGRHASESFALAALQAHRDGGPTFDARRWFMDGGDLFYVTGETHAVSNQWGDSFWPTIENFKRVFAKADFDVQPE